MTKVQATIKSVADAGKKVVPLKANQSAKPAPKNKDGLEDQILEAYRKLVKRPQDWASLTELRPMIDATKPELDAALKKMFLAQKINLTLNDDQGSLTAEDRKASIRIGVSDMHFMSSDYMPVFQKPASKAPSGPQRIEAITGKRPAAKTPPVKSAKTTKENPIFETIKDIKKRYDALNAYDGSTDEDEVSMVEKSFAYLIKNGKKIAWNKANDVLNDLYFGIGLAIKDNRPHTEKLQNLQEEVMKVIEVSDVWYRDNGYKWRGSSDDRYSA
jgi:hypothetical protein